MYRSQLLKILNPEHTQLAVDVTNQYAFITIDISKSGGSFGVARFELTDKEGKLTSFYCEDASLKKNISDKIESETIGCKM